MEDVGEAAGVGEDVMGVEVEAATGGWGSDGDGSGGVPFRARGPQGLRSPRGAAGRPPGCELAFTCESVVPVRACPLGAPGLPRGVGGAGKAVVEGASGRLEARAEEAAAARPPALPGPAPTNSSCASGQTKDEGVPPAQSLLDPRVAARLRARRRGRGTHGATTPMGCPSGRGRWPQTPGKSARRLAAQAPGPTAAPPR